MALLAMRTETPELMITQDEEALFLHRVQNVMRHYGTKANQKAMDWAALAGCTANMAWPRAVAIRNRRREEHGAHGQDRGQVLRWPIQPRARPEAAPAGDGGQVGAEGAPYVPSAPMGEPDGEGF